MCAVQNWTVVEKKTKPCQTITLGARAADSKPIEFNAEGPKFVAFKGGITTSKNMRKAIRGTRDEAQQVESVLCNFFPPRDAPMAGITGGLLAKQ